MSKFKKKLAFNLYKKNIITKKGFNFLVKNNYYKGDNFLISINNRRRSGKPYVINVIYNKSFMNIDVKSNKLYGRK